jgi:hypothetical protein
MKDEKGRPMTYWGGKQEVSAVASNDGVICFRCGCCGQPTDKDGQVLTLEAINSMDVDWDKAEKTHGSCCRHEQEDRRMQVTRDMAMDAGEPDMEGMLVEK